MVDSVNPVQSSLLSQIIARTLENVAKEGFDSIHVEGLRALVDSGTMTQEGLMDALSAEGDGGKSEDH